MNLTITAYSTALFSTWIFLEELGVLLDAGDGVSAGLLQKSRKIKHVFVSHPDRDHLMGLFQLNQLNGRPDYPIIHYPADSGSFPAIAEFQAKFDPNVPNAIWKPLKDKDITPIRKDMYVMSMRNEHIKAPLGVHKSIGFKIYQTKEKLKSEYAEMKGSAIRDLIQEKGKEAITETIHTNILTYSGDTPLDDYSKYDGSQILIHESTFLQDEKDAAVESKNNKHSKLDEVLKMVSEIKIETLILSHFSSRYKPKEINLAIQKLCVKYKINIPVYVIYPGEIHRDILKTSPVYIP